MKRDTGSDKGFSRSKTAKTTVSPSLKADPAGKTRSRRDPPVAQSGAPAPGERRFMSARALGAILPQVTRPAFAKRPASAVRLILDWAEIVGVALAAQSEPRKVSAGTLTIACTGPVALELQHLAPQLIERINTHCGPLKSGRHLRFDDGPGLISKIRILQDPTVSRPVSPAARPEPQPVAIPDMKAGELHDALARLGGHIRRRPRR